MSDAQDREQGTLSLCELTNGKWIVMITLDGREPVYSHQEFDTKEQAASAAHAFVKANGGEFHEAFH